MKRNDIIVESERFYARLLYPADIEEIIVLEADEEVKRYSGGVRTAIEAEDYLNQFGEKLPARIKEQFGALKARLG